MNLSLFTSKFRSKLIVSIYRNWVKENENVIDIGCGTGVVTKYLKDQLSIKITGCDIENYLIVDIPFKKMTDNKIPAEDNSYDTALLNDVLHHINKSDQTSILKESNRVAKKILIFEFEPTLIGKVADIILNKLHYDNLHIPLSVRSIDDWQNVFKSLGLNCETMKLNRPFWYPFSHIAFMLTKK